MEPAEAENATSRIVAGTTRCVVKDLNQNKLTYIVKSNTRYHRYLATELYKEFYEEALDSGLYDDNEYKDFLLNNNLWDAQREAKLKSLSEDVEELKVRMFSSSFNTQSMLTARKVLAAVKVDMNKLYYQKVMYNHISASGFAEMERNKFLLAMSLFKKDKPVVTEDSYWKFPFYILSQVISIYKDTRFNEVHFRWLARNEPWRSYWLAKKTENSLLNIPSVDLNDEQRTLVIWSNVYDNVYEHPEQPSQAVINDDDLLDGWFIVQKRKREKEINVSEANQILGNDKIKNSPEIFIPASSEEDMRKISSLNDTTADMAKRSKFNAVQKHGTVSEANLPDVRMELQQQYNQMYVDKVKGN